MCADGQTDRHTDRQGHRSCGVKTAVEKRDRIDGGAAAATEMMGGMKTE